MTALLLVVLAWAPKNTDVHARNLSTQPVHTHTSHFEKLGGAITITLPKIYVSAPHAGDVSKTKPVPSEACEEGLCSLSFHAETRALPTFSIRAGSMPKAGTPNLGRGEWKCADGRCVAEYRKVEGCCAATELAVAREVTKGKALVCVGSMDVPRSDDAPNVVQWITSVCDGIVFKADAPTK